MVHIRSTQTALTFHISTLLLTSYNSDMRNLSLSSSRIKPVHGANICATAIDLDQNVLFAASVNQNVDADLEVEIWKVKLDENDAQQQVSST